MLDVANLTQQEVSLSYPNDKTILIEPKESCRVPVPVERCPLDQILSDHQQQQQQLASSESHLAHIFPVRLTLDLFTVDGGTTFSGTYNVSEIDLPEKLCSEHIANLVNLRYQLSPSETHGVATLRGISLSSTMLDLVTVSPIQWGEYWPINEPRVD